jgi:hypothetical protein
VAEAFFVPDGDRYVTTELTRGPWDPGAVGLSDTALFDERGPIGRATQTLLIADRPPPA